MASSRGLPCFNNTLTGIEDQLQWNLTSTKLYSSNSFYKVITSTGRTMEGLRFTWHLKIPATIKIFAYLCIQDKLLTQDVLLRRGFECNHSCVQCQRCSLETTHRILFQCEFALLFWSRFSRYLGYNIFTRGDSVRQSVIRSYNGCRHIMPRKKWGVLFFSACWMLWKARNNKEFEDKCLPANLVAEHAFN
ncbi:uncharacterized protein LOC144568068 [Carex rostrata]